MTFHQAAPAGRPCAWPTGIRQGDLSPDEPAVDPFSLALPEIRGRGGMAKGPSRCSIP
jgi:hypothetical protein